MQVLAQKQESRHPSALLHLTSYILHLTSLRSSLQVPASRTAAARLGVVVVAVGGVGGHVGGHELHLLRLLVERKLAGELLPPWLAVGVYSRTLYLTFAMSFLFVLWVFYLFDCSEYLVHHLGDDGVAVGFD